MWNVRIGLPLLGTALLLGGLLGCGSHKVTLEVADVINDGGLGPNAAQMLDVDIVVLSRDDCSKHAQLCAGGVSTEQWFRMRQERTTGLDPQQIYALRPAGSGDMRDTFVGPPLLSGKDTPNRTTTVELKYPEGLFQSLGAIVIYGRFVDAKTSPPLVIRDPERKEILVSVGSRDFRRLGGK
jgi:hypothetical protein